METKNPAEGRCRIHERPKKCKKLKSEQSFLNQFIYNASMFNQHDFYYILIDTKNGPVIPHAQFPIPLKRAAQRLAVYIWVRGKFFFYRDSYLFKAESINLRKIPLRNKWVVFNSKAHFLNFFQACSWERNFIPFLSRSIASSPHTLSSSISSARRKSSVALVARGVLSRLDSCESARSTSGGKLMFNLFFVVAIMRQVYQKCITCVKRDNL